MNRIFLKIQRDMTLEAIREMRCLLAQAIKTVVPRQSVRQRILLCFSEAATNLVAHTKPVSGQISMHFGRDNHGWWLEIFDNSTPWNPTIQEHTTIPENFKLIEDGRGTSLLNSQCDRMEYYAGSDTEHNRLRLFWATTNQKQRPTILIAEDNESLRRLYELYLEETFEVTSAASGQEALLKLKTEQIDLVLSDICMPQMDGIALREQLIEDADSQLIPFVFLTAMSDAAHLERASNLGIDDYLIKPVNKAQLLSTIQRVLKRSLQIYQKLTDRIDEDITSALAPSLPDTANGWRLGLASRHTGSGGGDLLLHQSGDTMFQIVLTDIMGHDDSAKFFAHACGGYLRGLMHAVGADSDPAQLLEQLSDFAMQDKLMSKITLTCCSAALSAGGEISLAGAGHPPPLRISSTGVETLAVGGILPGLLPDTRYQSIRLKLACGERIALYTDGLFEAAADEKVRRQLEQRITSALAATLSRPIDQALHDVMAVFDQLAGTPPKDDVLLLLIEPEPVES